MVDMEKICGNCQSAKRDRNLKPDLCVCFEGYGIKRVTDKPCGAFILRTDEPTWSEGIVEKASDKLAEDRELPKRRQ